MFWGLFCAESVKVSPFFSLTLPFVVGWNSTPTSQLAPAASEAPQLLLLMRKGALAVISVIVTAVVLESLVTVSVCGPLVSPTKTWPKLIFFLEKLSVGGLTGLSFFESTGCANAGRANTVSRNNIEKVRPANERVNIFSRTVISPPVSKSETNP